MALFVTKNLIKNYINEDIETHVLHGISLTIKKGEFISIMGQSGSGKSTLLHILGFLDPPTSGTYKFENKSIDNYTPSEIAHIRNKKMGFIFQSFNLLQRATVFENVKLPLLYSKIPESEWKSKVLKAIEEVNLSHRTNYLGSKLSGGEKQRVAIARALVNNPEVIFADEPTGNLDSKTGKQIMDLLYKLHKEKKHTIILITHEKSTAEYANRTIILQDGKIAQDKKNTRKNKKYQK